jgi:hypothetical protein
MNRALRGFQAHTGAQKASQQGLGDFGNNPTPY